MTLTASPASGYQFAGWSGACSGVGSCTLTVSSAATVSAQFVPVAGAYPCGNHPCAHGEFPPATWRPYAASSPFNTAVESAPELIPPHFCGTLAPGTTCSAAIISRLLGDISQYDYPGNWLVATTGTTGWPTYYGVASDPVYNIACTKYDCSQMLSGRAPAGAAVQGGGDPSASPDRHLTFVDQVQGIEFDLWELAVDALPPGGGTVSTGYSGYTTLSGDGRSAYGEGTAAHIGNLAGRIRLEEVRDAVACSMGTVGCTTGRRYINHALTVTVNCTSGLTIAPAGSNPGRPCSALASPLSNENAPPMGAHLHLDMTISAIDALPVSEWKKVLLRTLSVYGAYVNDTGSSNYFDWQLESGLQYQSMNVADQWLLWAADMAQIPGTQWENWDDEYGVGYKGLWNRPDGLDWRAAVWSHLRVLAR